MNSRPDVDDVINYLSIKFNKIFCERDFVCCVINDFTRALLDKKAATCRLLVFPTLGPIYLKALRYQARIFDLAAFNVSCGKFRSLAICHKDHLIVNKTNQDTLAMEIKDDNTRRKRPERKLYVPPAQRRSSRSSASTPQVKISEPKKSVEKCEVKCLLTLSDFNYVFDGLYTFPCDWSPLHCHSLFVPENTPHTNCEFQKYLNHSKWSKTLWDSVIPFYGNKSQCFNHRWNFQHFSYSHKKSECSASYPMFDCFHFKQCNSNFEPTTKSLGVLVEINQNYYYDETLVQLLNEHETDTYKIFCTANDLDSVDILDLQWGHFFIVKLGEGDENCLCYECQEKHDAITCYNARREMLEASNNSDQSKITNNQLVHLCKLETDNTNLSDSKVTTNNNPTPPPSKAATAVNVKNNSINTNNHNNRQIKDSSSSKKKQESEHEQEKEIMRKTKENINRRSRPIIKYVDDKDIDTLSIGKDSVNNWEDLFDDSGEIQEELLTEIVEKVGHEVTIIQATEDYTDYTNKPPEDLEHVVELFDFPSTLETHDLVQAFSQLNSDSLYIKWVDDNHALLVLGSLSQAQRAVNVRNPLIKARPMTVASAVSLDVAHKSDLRPAMKRPATNLQTARRLITSHLGTKSKLSKEQIAQERLDLKNAREQKRLTKQSEKDAWEGNIRSAVN